MESILTNGQVFPNGCIVDRLSDDRLVLWEGGSAIPGQDVEYQGHTYRPMPLDPNLERTLLLPRDVEPRASIGALVDNMSDCLQSYVGLEARWAFLVSLFALSTWVADCLPRVPWLVVAGAPEIENLLAEILSCVVRRPLRLAEASIAELARLPEGLSPTLVLKSPAARNLASLMAASADPGVKVLRAGSCLDLQFAAVVFTRQAVVIPALKVPLTGLGDTYRQFSRAQAEAMRERLQPRLLGFRLSQHARVTESQFDCPEFVPEARTLARLFGATVEGEESLQARVRQTVGYLDAEYRERRSLTVEAVLLEAMLVLCHEHQVFVQIVEATELANGILLGRHAGLELSCKAAGGILRNEFGFEPQRRGPGYAIRLDSRTRERIHALAKAHSVVTLQHSTPKCMLCQELATKCNAGLSEQMHDVQEVHTAQDKPPVEAV